VTAIAHLVETRVEKKDMTEVITRDGVKLKIRAVPSLVVLAIQKQCNEPAVPIFRNEEKQRDEENPNDPNYIRAVKDYNEKVGELTTQAYLANGIEVVEPLPDGIYSLDDDKWAEGLKLVGLDIPDEGIARKVAYLRWYLIPDEDVADIIGKIAVAGGVVSEEQIAKAAESFRDNTQRDTDTEVPSANSNGLGNTTGDTIRAVQ
jgi:hypothetical protein